jgi:5-methylcytosine-specific restriction endonuclease McrA
MTEEQIQKRRAANAARMRAWREANPELAKERMRAFEAANRERRRAAKAAYRAVNPEHYKKKSKESAAKWRADHPEESRAYLREYRTRPGNREKIIAVEKASKKKARAKRKAERDALPVAPLLDTPKAIKQREYMRVWRARNSEKYREQKRIWNNNRDRKCKAGGKLTRAEWRAILAKQDGLCFDCGERRRMTIGHLVPISKGGSHNAANIVAQCMACNLKQRDSIHPSVKE